MTVTSDEVAELRAKARAAEVELFEQSVAACLASFATHLADPPSYDPRDDDWGGGIPTCGPRKGAECGLGEWIVRFDGSAIQGIVGGPDGKGVEVARFNVGRVREAIAGD